jgi:DNA (cytosine-5)-methyltransferase 1
MPLGLFEQTDEHSLFGWHPERFELSRESVTRIVAYRSGGSYRTTHPLPFDLYDADASALFDAAWLRRSSRPDSIARGRPVSIVDLFSGCGGLTLGVVEACNALGYWPKPTLAVDTDPTALAVFARNFPDATVLATPVEQLLDGPLGSPKTDSELQLTNSLGSVDILVGGPPCQGHSDLNNHSRRNDPKNLLYERMARFAEVLAPSHIIIENVPGVVHDRGGVVATTWSVLRRLGYFVEGGVLLATHFGVPQRRKRFVTVASRTRAVQLNTVLAAYRRQERSLRWAIGDLLDTHIAPVYDTASNHSADNKRRIDFLFDNGVFDLPDEQRPDCHRLKKHSYRSVYGRLRWREPAPTITCGFGSTGQGRFVHPDQRRTLTPHEAARLQFFPDSFDFTGVGRRELQTLIGNAVPPKLAYVIAVELLR